MFLSLGLVPNLGSNLSRLGLLFNLWCSSWGFVLWVRRCGVLVLIFSGFLNKHGDFGFLVGTVDGFFTSVFMEEVVGSILSTFSS